MTLAVNRFVLMFFPYHKFLVYAPGPGGRQEARLQATRPCLRGPPLPFAPSSTVGRFLFGRLD